MSSAKLMTLGGFGFSVDGVPTVPPATRKARALMTFLIMHRGADTARDRLLEMFWPDAESDHARDSLRTALWSIRRCLRTAGIDADGALVATRSLVRWNAETTVDALQFADLAARDDSAASQAALQLYQGDFLEGDYDDWAVSERERLAALYETVLARAMRSSHDSELARRIIARNPYDEEAYATLIAAELAAGRRASAAAWVERCRKALSEVGDRPSAAFDARFGAIVYVEPLVSDELKLPFAGRDDELALLAARLGAAVNGRGSVTLVHGEAGIGKSTLLDRSARIAAENGLRLLEIRCGDETRRAFGPWQEVFEAVGAGAFDAFVRSHAGDPVSSIAHAIAAALTEPAAIILDDVHELTGDAFEIFAAFVERTAPAHAIAVGSRPEGVASVRARLTDVAFDELPLGRLERDKLQWALAQALGGEEPDVLSTLYDRTGGHPLFFTGLLNSLISSGALARDGHRWHLTKPIDATLELPETVRRHIETRLNARGDNPRAVACALALEPTASADDLIAVLRLEETTVLDALDDLLALGLILQPSSGPQFAFSHDLTREVAKGGLNVGRRTVLHRAFAQRLKSSAELEAALRVARHLDAAGDALDAAQSYLKSASDAVDVNAAQAALERCDAGIRAARTQTRTNDRDLILAKLYTLAGRAALSNGDVDAAVSRARDAVSFARSCGDARESAQAILALATMEGSTFHVADQKAGAEEAGLSARSCGDGALEALALVQSANAARCLGLKDEALRAAQSALALARTCGRPDVAQVALQELLQIQTTWWLFDDALTTARLGLAAARRADPIQESAFLQARAALWYLLERFDEARTDIREAMRIADDCATRRPASFAASLHSLPLLQFNCHYVAGKLAVALKDPDTALAAAREASTLTNVGKLPRQTEALSLLQIDALMQRNEPGDGEAAQLLSSTLDRSASSNGHIGWSDCVDLARARVAVRLHLPSADSLLFHAINVLEENAFRAPLDADRAFARLADAASERGDAELATQARGRARHFWSRRRAAAGAAWGEDRELTHAGRG